MVRELGSNRQSKLVAVNKFGGFRRQRRNEKSTHIGEILIRLTCSNLEITPREVRPWSDPVETCPKFFGQSPTAVGLIRRYSKNLEYGIVHTISNN